MGILKNSPLLIIHYGFILQYLVGIHILYDFALNKNEHLAACPATFNLSFTHVAQTPYTKDDSIAQG